MKHDRQPQAQARPSVPDQAFYQPLFSPWRGYGEFAALYARAASHTVSGAESCHVLYSLTKQALGLKGELWECGVYKGGTAALLADLAAGVRGKRLRLFDTFAGMPEADVDPDPRVASNYADTSLAAVRRHVGHDKLISYHAGAIPQTFAGLENSVISLAHVDLGSHQSVLDCCSFIFPRLVQGGFMVFGDYGSAESPGARAAVDEFFARTGQFPLVLQTGQALVFKSARTRRR